MTPRRRPGSTDRRTFLKTAGAVAGTAVAAGFPAVLRAQAPTVKIGTLHCVTGPLAEPGQACRVGAQMAADAINAAGGIKSMGGARIELLLGDTQTKAEVARAEAVGDDHDADMSHAHEAHDAHEPAHARPLPFAPTDSPWLITVPLLLLGLFSIISGYLNAAAFKTNYFDRWIEAAVGVELPKGGEFKWVNALPSVIMIAAGFAISLAVCMKIFGTADSKLKGLTRRSRVLGAGYSFLVNKYYLDYLYEQVIVHGIAHPIAAGAYWINQHVLDGVVNAVGIGGRKTGDWVYKNVDQRVVDGAVNGSGTVARTTGGVLQPVQSGKVSMYGALLFGAAAVGALVLVLVNS